MGSDFFYSPPKKVFLHTEHTEKLTYVVGSYVGDSRNYTKSFLWHHMETPHRPLVVFSTFQLDFL